MHPNRRFLALCVTAFSLSAALVPGAAADQCGQVQGWAVDAQNLGHHLPDTVNAGIGVGVVYTGINAANQVAALALGPTAPVADAAVIAEDVSADAKDLIPRAGDVAGHGPMDVGDGPEDAVGAPAGVCDGGGRSCKDYDGENVEADWAGGKLWVGSNLWARWKPLSGWGCDAHGGDYVSMDGNSWVAANGADRIELVVTIRSDGWGIDGISVDASSDGGSGGLTIRKQTRDTIILEGAFEDTDAVYFEHVNSRVFTDGWGNVGNLYQSVSARVTSAGAAGTYIEQATAWGEIQI